MVVFGAFVVAPAAHASAATSTATTGARPSTCGQGSWVAGTTDICDGELVYRDYVYDDFGARPSLGVPVPTVISGLQFQSLPSFDAYGGYPHAGGQSSHDQTDLVALRLTVDGGTVHVSAELNTMVSPDVAKVVLAVDTDANAATDGGAIPGVLANPSPATPLHATGWDAHYELTGGDVDTNVLTGTFPLPAAPTWRLWAVVATTSGTAMNVAFRGIDEHGFWWEDAQADALAAGDITNFAATITTSDLTGHVTRHQDVAPGAVRERVYVSATPIGEGVSDSGVPGPGYAPGSPGEAVSQAFTFLGKYQPYGFWEPTGPEPHGVELALHGLAENHSARFTFPGIPATHFGEVMGNERNRIIASPLGRGWKGWYSSYSERDVMDVLADVEANYAVDTTKVVMSGYSMGGYGAMRIAALHPDLFAGIVNWVGYTGDFFNGTPLAGLFFNAGSNVGADVNAVDVLGSLRHVPMVALYSGADELVTVTGALAVEQRLSALHVPSIFYLHPVAEHLTYALLDNWQKESNASASFALVQNPSHVTYRTDRRLYEPQLGLVPDHAYWVSDIVPAADGYADVDAVSLGCGDDEPITTDVPSTGTDPVPWVANEVKVVGTNHRAAADRIELHLSNISSLTIDSARACLTPGADVDVVSNVPVTVRFTDGRVVTAAASAATTSPSSPTPSPSMSPSVSASGNGRQLARTGGTTSALVPLLLALAVAVWLSVGGGRGRRRAHRRTTTGA